MDYERIEQLLADLGGRMDNFAERLDSLEARRYEEALTLYDNLRVST